MSRVPDVPQLTGLRAIGAVWVLLLHSYPLMLVIWPQAYRASSLALAGNLGVDLFFVLSGFIITLNYGHVLDRWSWRRAAGFWWLRLARVYPVFLLTLIAWSIYFVIHPSGSDWLLSPGNIAMNVLLLNHVPPGSSISTVSWSVCLEAGAYLAFPLLALALVRLRSAWLPWVLAALVTGGGLVLLESMDVHGLGLFTYSAGWTRLAMQFLTGCLLCLAWSRSGRWRTGLHWDVVGGLAAIGIVIACTSTDITDIGFYPVAAVPCLGLVVVAVAGSTGPLRRAFATRPAMWLGRISYSLYMTHTMTLALATTVTGVWSTQTRSGAVQAGTALLIYASAIVVAAAVFHLVEEPARRKLRGPVDRARVVT